MTNDVSALTAISTQAYNKIKAHNLTLARELYNESIFPLLQATAETGENSYILFFEELDPYPPEPVKEALIDYLRALGFSVHRYHVNRQSIILDLTITWPLGTSD